MRQEDKQLLFVDLSSRLPYRVKCFHPHGVGELDSIEVKDYGIHVIFKTPDDNYYSIEDCKPYLRPLSSMTEEEYDDMFRQLYSAQEEIFRNCSDTDTIGKLIANDMVRYDWLNKNMFDYRGLIEKGLALEASEEMYKN